MLNVERATFTPAVFLTAGGMSNECKRFVNRVADLIARKRKEKYCDVRCSKACKNKDKFCNAKNNAYCSTWVQRKKDKQQT